MNDAKHTKGPWKVDEGRSIVAKWDSGEEVQIAAMSTSHWSTHPDYDDVKLNHSRNMRISNESEANARLIAAAPDLLEACKQVEEAWAGNGDMASAVDTVLLAIAKAEGK